MTAGPNQAYVNTRLSNEDFSRLGSFIQSSIGIKMPKQKKIMVEARLRKRLRNLNLATYTDYCDYLFSKEGMKDEWVNLIDVITTNKTDFFREPDHFDLLNHTILSSMINGLYRRLSIWSTACSTGEEPYTLAMIMEEYAKRHPESRFDYTILATDISNEVLSDAMRAVYSESRVEKMHIDLKKKYLLRSKDRSRKLVRITPELRKKVKFQPLNLMDEKWEINQKMDIIFCRNVIIYFERDIQVTLLKHLCDHLKPNGYIFMGHSEVLAGLNLPLKSIAPTVYQKMD